MKLKQFIFSGVLVTVLSVAHSVAYGQSVEFLGVTNDGQRAQIKAKVDLAGQTPTAVTAYSYNMNDGYTVTNTNYEFVKDGEVTYLTADIFYSSGETEYTHRVEITFGNGTKYLSPVVKEDLTEQFMWLGDYAFTQASSGWDTAHPPTVDREIDPSLTMMLDGVHYYKGVCNHATGHIYYWFPTAPFTRFVTKYGVQDDRTEGNIHFFMYTSEDDFGKTPPQISQLRNEMSPAKVDQIMYAKTNPSNPNPGGPFALDANLDMNNIKSLLFYFDSNGVNYGDHGHLAMARLYLPVENKNKTQQTVTFNTPAQKITGEITLDATASANGNVFYRIVSGRDLATIQGNVLKPVWGKSGTVVVEATQYGDDTHYPATAYQTFTLDLQPKMELLGVYNPSMAESTNNHLYLLVDTKGRTLDQLNVKVFDNVNTLVEKTNINLIGNYNSSKDSQVIDFVLPGGYTNQVLQVSYSYSDDAATVTLPYWHAEGSFDYISDKPTSSYKMTAGWSSPSAPNKSFNGDNNGVLNIVANPDVVYAKGLGTHARGTLEMQPEVLTPYNRVAADMGAQKGYGGNTGQTMAYSIESGNQVVKTTKTLNETTGLYEGGDVTKDKYVSWDVPFNNSAILRLIIDKGSDNKDDNDHVCIGAPRLYYTPVEKTSQTIDWQSECRILNNRQTEVVLDAVSSSGMPVYYYLVKGSEYARLDGNKLVINQFPSGGEEIIVDAYQPGDDVFATSQVASCTFSLVHGLEIPKGEYVEIKGPDTLDELVIYADKDASGQFNIKSGIVDVKKIVLKYTFIPGEWTYLSFPSDLNIDKISNLNALGYTYNGFNVPSYVIRQLNGDAYSTEDEVNDNIWTTLETPQVKALKGYTMAIDDLLTDQPVEVTFTIDNEGVDLVNLMRSLGLSIDFSSMQIGGQTTLTVKATNVESNNLTIDVTFNPSNTSSLPVNHEQALERMRYVFVNGHKAIRLTLPDQTPARVVFFDKEGKKVVKAVKYISPNVIDLRDLKPGQYNMMIQYGPATRAMTIDL